MKPQTIAKLLYVLVMVVCVGYTLRYFDYINRDFTEKHETLHMNIYDDYGINYTSCINDDCGEFAGWVKNLEPNTPNSLILQNEVDIVGYHIQPILTMQQNIFFMLLILTLVVLAGVLFK